LCARGAGRAGLAARRGKLRPSDLPRQAYDRRCDDCGARGSAGADRAEDDACRSVRARDAVSAASHQCAGAARVGLALERSRRRRGARGRLVAGRRRTGAAATVGDGARVAGDGGGARAHARRRACGNARARDCRGCRTGTLMRVVITGGAGFLGSRLARAILERGALTDSRGQTRPIRELVLVDVVAPATAGDPRVRAIVGSLADRAVVDAVISSQTDSVFHLAAVVSGQAEAEFDVGMRVNVDATRNLLERCRACAVPPKFVFASSLAVFGGTLPDPVPDDAPVTPQTSYGTQKAIAELLVSDMSRKGFIDGRSLRLPTIVVRPGKPNKAASSFASGIIREPLSHVAAICPVAPATALWVQSPHAVIANFVIGHEAPAS